MAKLTKLVHNIETGEISEVELTAAELAEANAQTQAKEERFAAEAKQIENRAALLAKLGITEDEAKLLLS